MKFLLKFLLILGVLAAFFLFFAYIYYSADLPNVEEFEKDNNKQIIQINFSNEQPITSFGDVNRKKVEFYELPQNLIKAVIATEDQKFFTHQGIDIIAIIRAFYVNHKAGRIVQGASTITQQLAKMLFLSPEKTFKRKIQEVILAFKIEQKYSKEQILTMYLNHAYFGAGNYGIASACDYYFKKPVSEINLNESALLAGLLKAPSKLSPKNDKKSAKNRANLILKNMAKSGFLDEDNLDEIDDGIVYKTNRLQRLYFADYVYDNFSEYLSVQDLRNKKIIVNTSLNQKIQEKVEEQINNFVDENEKKLAKSEIAIIVMNKEGAILAMSGGKDYQKSQYNRAIFSKRQSGSVFKTFVYMTAFENGFKPEDIFEDKKINVATWLPDNFEGKYFGKVSLQDAFAYSLNSVSIQLAQKINRKEIIKIAKKLGIVSEMNNQDLTIALGTSEVSLLELTNAFASIANDANPVIPFFVNDIKNQDDKNLYQHSSSGFSAIVSQDSVLNVKKILRAVVEYGTGKKANIANDVYGKTGTSQNFRDAWFVGFDDNYVIGIWIGNDDNSPTNKITGGSLPAELFARILKNIK